MTDGKCPMGKHGEFDLRLNSLEKQAGNHKEIFDKINSKVSMSLFKWIIGFMVLIFLGLTAYQSLIVRAAVTDMAAANDRIQVAVVTIQRDQAVQAKDVGKNTENITEIKNDMRQIEHSVAAIHRRITNTGRPSND